MFFVEKQPPPQRPRLLVEGEEAAKFSVLGCMLVPTLRIPLPTVCVLEALCRYLARTHAFNFC